MIVWIVSKFTGRSYELVVFDTEEAAKTHQTNLTKKWAISTITQHEVQSI